MVLVGFCKWSLQMQLHLQKNKTAAKIETKKKQLGKSLFHKMSFKRSLEMGQRRTIFDISRQSIPETRSSYWKRSIPPWMFWMRFAEQRHFFGTEHTRWVIWFEEICDILWCQIVKWFKNNKQQFVNYSVTKIMNKWTWAISTISAWNVRTRSRV